MAEMKVLLICEIVMLIASSVFCSNDTNWCSEEMHVPKVRLVMKGEFPWVLFVAFNSGPYIAGGLLSMGWGLTSTATSVNRRLHTTSEWKAGQGLGIVYAGWVKGNLKQGENCTETAETEGYQCRYITEIVPQDDRNDPASGYLLLRFDRPFSPAEYLGIAPLPAQERLPDGYREQCVALWFVMGEFDVVGEEPEFEEEIPDYIDEPVPRPRRSMFGSERAAWIDPDKNETWSLMAQPVGLWHASRCDGRAVKPALACEDTWMEELRILQTLRDFTGRPSSDDFGVHGGSPGLCTQRGRSHAAAYCQETLAAFRLMAEDVEDLLLTGGKYKDSTAPCTARSRITRRLWLWTGGTQNMKLMQEMDATGEKATYQALKIEEVEC